jgi:hypothetical protein
VNKTQNKPCKLLPASDKTPVFTGENVLIATPETMKAVKMGKIL